MVHHIILWKFKEGLSENEKEEVRKNAKNGLEGLKSMIPEIQKIHVQTETLPTSNADIMLDSEFKTPEDLKTYSEHPNHVKIAKGSIMPFMEVRMCLDYED